MLRVCSGTARGILLKSPRGTGVRPTSAMVRQAVFSALGSRIPGSSVLDLYAGTGAMGIEALSRGAKEALFVELSPTCAKIIKENLERTRLFEKGLVIQGDALRVLRDLARQRRKFDIIIADPPYEKERGTAEPPLAEKTLMAVVDSDILAPHSLIVLEHSGIGVGSETVCGLRLLSKKKYGDTVVSTFCPVKTE